MREKYGSVVRHEKVVLKAQDEQGKTFTYNASGLVAQIFQHECDHLDGVLYPMRIEDMRQFGYTEVLFPQLAADGDDD